MKLSKETKMSLEMGILCSFAYLIVYFSRNLLSVATPEMLEAGFTTESIGLLSTLFMLSYGAGQLVNGIVGDRVGGKWMICLGMVLAGIFCLFFLWTGSPAAYTLTGLALSMIYAPMTKMISENMDLSHATKILLGLTLASLVAAPLAGLAAVVLRWRALFLFGSGLLILGGLVCFVFLTCFERRGGLEYHKFAGTGEKGGLRTLLDHEIIKYSFVSVITGIIRTSVVFWIPAYLARYLHYSSAEAAGIYSAVTLIVAAAPYLGVALREIVFHRNTDRTLLWSFALGSGCFFAMCLVKAPLWNILLLVLALLGGNVAAAMLWNVYCPGLRETGLVSGATGYLDFISYGAGALANWLFGNAVEAIGWYRLLIVWGIIMAAGIPTGLHRRIRSRAAK